MSDRYLVVPIDPVLLLRVDPEFVCRLAVERRPPSEGHRWEFSHSESGNPSMFYFLEKAVPHE